MRTSPNRLVATIFGVVYVVVGLAGFFATSGVGFVDTRGGLLLGVLEVNPPHNLLHLLLGIGMLLAGTRGVRPAKLVNAILGCTFLAVGLAGLFVIGGPLNVLALNGADNVLHFASSVVLLAVGAGSEHSGARTSAQ